VVFAYRTITVYGTPFQGVSANQTLSRCSPSEIFPSIRNTPDVIPLQPPALLKKVMGLDCFPFRSPLLREFTLLNPASQELRSNYLTGSICFLFLRVLRCFTSPGLLPDPYGSRAFRFIVETGFPIRKSPDQRLVATFPRLIASTLRPSSPQLP
jgi:hypothetical protein